MMGAALLALTVSLVWAGQKFPLPTMSFPNLITTSFDSGAARLSTETAASAEKTFIRRIERRRKCGSVTAREAVAPERAVPAVAPVPEI